MFYSHCLDCGEVIRALEECHALPYIQRMMGQCNNFKDELNKCLKAERLDRMDHRRQAALEKRKKVEARWKEMEEEEYGKNGVLKKVM